MMTRLLVTAALCAAMTGAARAQTVDCANPGCETRLSPACLQRLDAGAVAAGDACEAEQSAYVACLTAVAERCQSSAGARAVQSGGDWRDAFIGDWVRVEQKGAGPCSLTYRFAREGETLRWSQRKEGVLDWTDRGLADVSSGRDLSYVDGQVTIRIADGALYLFNRPDRWVCKFAPKS